MKLLLESLKRAKGSNNCYRASEVNEESARVAGVEFEDVQGYFCQTKIDDYGEVSYSNRKQKSTRSETKSLIYFIPDAGADLSKVQSEIKRGLKFFNQKDGMLFGAKVDLWKLGKFAEIRN